MFEPRQSQPTTEPRALFENNLAEIERVVTWISRRTCLSGEDAEEFGSWVHVKLMEDDFGILRSYSGRSSLATYLTTVVHNLARDFKSKRWGRWRPSAAAERLGVAAVQLETMIYRDGFSSSVAAEMLQRHHGVRMTTAEIATLTGKLPQRARHSVEGGDQVEAAPARESSDEQLMGSEGRTALDEARSALQESLSELDTEDRLILRMHYESGLTIAAIAVSLGLRQRRLYTRREASLRTLRAGLERRGLDAEHVLDALEWSEGDRDLDFQADSAKPGDSGPSNPREPKGSSVE